MDCSPPDSSVYGISQARILEWVVISFSGDLPDPGIELTSPAFSGRFFTTSAIWEAHFTYYYQFMIKDTIQEQPNGTDK